ncbi:hypothetical protein Tco_0365553 [Tanacetum coccineum]
MFSRTSGSKVFKVESHSNVGYKKRCQSSKFGSDLVLCKEFGNCLSIRHGLFLLTIVCYVLLAIVVDRGTRSVPLFVVLERDRLKALVDSESLEIRQAFADVVSTELAKGMSEGMQYGIEYGKAGRYLGDVEAYDPKANEKFVKALQDLKDLKYPIVDQLERLKDSPIDLIMVSLHLESDTEEDSPQWICDLCPSSSQLKIPIYPEKKKCRVVCHTHGVSFVHHSRSDGVAVSVLTAAPQGLAILLTDAATRTEGSEGEVSPRLIRSRSLPPMFNSEWP